MFGAFHMARSIQTTRKCAAVACDTAECAIPWSKVTGRPRCFTARATNTGLKVEVIKECDRLEMRAGHEKKNRRAKLRGPGANKCRNASTTCGTVRGRAGAYAGFAIIRT